MKKNPLVSIIIPVYNEERHLKEVLDSIFAQTYKEREIIAIDDGSNDSSAEILKNYKIKYIRQEHSGPGSARNLGAMLAKGKILIFLDADMKYKNDYVEKITKPIIQQKIIGTFNNEEYVANSENIWAYCWNINANLSKNKRSPFCPPKKIFVFRAIRRDVFLKAKGFDISKGYFDDGTLGMKLKIKAVNVPGAKSYHNNPETLKDVFESARWLGKSSKFKLSITNLLKFSLFNSLRHSFLKICNKAPKRYIFFKIIYDLGLLSGIIFRGKGYGK